MRVLIADDHEPVLTALAHVLIEGGHDVVGLVGDGRSALIQTQRLRPDLIVLDMLMPGMDGVTAAQAIKALDENVAIVMHTAVDDDEVSAALLEAGAHAVVVKSANPAPLLAAVDRLEDHGP